MINRILNKIKKLKEDRRVKNLVNDVAKAHKLLQNKGYDKNSKEIVLLCLYKNGAAFIPSFMQHYKSMGFKNFVFIDNNSDDESIALLQKEEVLILQSKLPYKIYKWAFKQYLVQKYAENRWSLYVDIDELWDYPHSDKIALDQFVAYLDQNNYTAVQAHMLDMFSDQALSSLNENLHDDLRKAYPYYELEGFLPKKYSKAYNIVNNDNVKHYWGGVHNTFFGITNIYLSKLPMIKWNSSISVHESSHTSTHVNIADVSTVLLHYKFVYGFYEKAKALIEEGSYWNASETYKKYLDVLAQNPDLSLKNEHSKKYIRCQQLVDEDFLMSSSKYNNFVDSLSA